MKTIQALIIGCILGCQLEAQVSFNLSSSPGVGNGPNGVTSADVNGDGQMDLMCVNYYGHSISVVTNNGSGGFVLSGTYTAGTYPHLVVTADVNEDGKLDLICANSYSGDSTLSVLTNNGSGGFVLSGTYPVGIGPLWVTAADVNGDGMVDLISVAWGSAEEGNTLTILTNNGGGGFVLASSPVVGPGPYSVTAADVNGDGQMDLISANQGDNTLSVLTNDGSGGFMLSGAYPVGSVPRTVVASDVNGDGKVDLICANQGDNTLTVLTNNGIGIFGSNATINVGNGVYSVAAADVNGDGWVDLISANLNDNTLTILTNDGIGGFVLATNLSVGEGPQSVAAADVNDDGKVDLICVDSGNNALLVFTNATPVPHNTPPIITAQPSGITVSVGATATFSVSVVGAQPLAYQWQFGGTNIESATNAMLTLSNVQLSQAGDYSVLVTNILGSTNSVAATLTVMTYPPAIAAQPTNQTVQIGGTASFTVTANGTAPLFYQWNFNGSDIAGATNATLTLTNVQSSQAGSYAVSVTNEYGSTVSSNAVLSVMATLDHFAWNTIPSPQSVNQPFGVTITAQNLYNATVSNFTGAVSLQPSSNGASTDSGLILNGGFETGTLTNWTLVKNTYGQFVINNGTVIPPGAHGSLAPYAGSWCALGDESGPGVFYMYQDISIPAGVSGATLNWAHCVRNYYTSFNSGQGFQVRICDTNNNVLATAFTTSPGNALLGNWVQTNYDMTAFAGQKVRVMFWVDSTYSYIDAYVDNVSLQLPANLSVTPTNTGNFVNGVWNGSVTVQQTATNDVLMANDGDGHTGSSNPFNVLSPPNPPGIIMQPTNQTVTAGQTATFTVNASGTTPLSYQWFVNGTDIIVGATNSTLTLTNVQVSQNGYYYSVLVTNLYGSTVSSNAVLSVMATLDQQVSFNLSSSPVVGNGANGVTAADVNGDGKVDLMCANYYDGSLSVLTNNGSGGFVLSGTYNVGTYPHLVVAADVNGDGKLDLICCNSDSGDSTLSVLTNNGSGGFALSGTYPVGTGPLWVTAADVNGDGKVDLISVSWGSAGEGNTLTVLTNNGSGGFVFASSPVVGPGPYSVTAADVNGDGQMDLISANQGDNALSVLTNDGGGGFVLSGTYPVGSVPRTVVASDVNGDGKVDLVCANQGDNTLTVLTNNGSGIFGSNATINVGNGAYSVAAADVNGDGWVDLISANLNDNTLSVLTNDGSGGFMLATNLNVGTEPESVTAADVNGDGKVDLISSSGGGNTLTVLTNATPFPITSPIITAQPSGITVSVGATATFSASAEGAQPLTYQWQFGGTNIANATNATLTLSNVQLSQAGNYSVLVTNLYGSTNSVAATLTVNGPVCTPAPSSMVAWWPAEGNANDIIGGNNGTMVNGASFAAGEAGQAFLFSGSNYVSVPDAPALDPTNAITVECWLYRRAVVASYDAVVKKSGTAGVSAANGYSLEFDGNNILFWIYSGNGGWQSSGGAVPIQLGQWYHIAGVYDGAHLLVYINGQLAASSSTSGSMVPSVNTLCIGNDPVELARFFNGSIDEVSIYNRALSSNEIAAIYNAGSAGKCFTPVAPAITTQPANQTVLVGGTVNFSVTASGTGSLNYQWSVNGTNVVVGATNSTLTLTSVQLSQNGYSYSVLVTNLYGSTNSVAATLTVSVPVCTPAPSGMVAWWPAEGNANDIIGGNNGTLTGGVTFATGEVGQAFAFNTTTAAVKVAASPALNVGAGAGFTIECWVNPSDISQPNPLVEWNNGSAIGVHFYVTVTYPGNLYANIVDSGGAGGTSIWTGPGVVTNNAFQHVALTFDKASGVAKMYHNGALVLQQVIGNISPQTMYDVYLGRRPTPGDVLEMSGLMDEVGIYNRALTSNEIAAIYNAGSAGKCFTPVAPAITTQPTNQTVQLGGTAAFSVTASGTGPLSYQWCVNGTNIVVGATNSTLTLTNVQLSQNGYSYSVLVTNLYGSTNSVVATLTVNAPVCVSPPSGLVSWWQAEGNANDSIGTNNGVLDGGLGFAPGEVGQAFFFNNTNDDVKIPASSSLNVGAGNGFTLEAWVYCTNVTQLNPIFEWNKADGTTYWGVHFYVGAGGPGTLYANIVDNGGGWHNFWSAGGIVASNVFQHVALTYDKATGTAAIYLNGAIVAQSVVGSLIPQTTYDLYLGKRPGPDTLHSFAGLLDEPSIYNRALSSNEIAAIYNAGTAGKCFTPVAPAITTQPTNQTVLAGGTAAFSVTATGTGSLNYQWSVNGTNIDRANNSTLTLNNVQLTQTGNYSVRISNNIGSTNSIAATLTVVLPPAITRQPQNQSVPSYNSASFTVAATGTGPLSYQWRKGGTNLVDGGNVSGSTTTNLVLASVSLSDAGIYDVVVSNPYATTNSAMAALAVPQTEMMLGSASAMSGNTVVVPVLMNALGVENAFLASVGYDPAALVLQRVQLGQAAAGAYLQEVDTKTNSGLVGFAILLNSGSAMPSGINEQVALLTFQALPVTSNTTISVFFTNSPTVRQIYDNNFDLLPAVYSNGIVTLLPAEYEADVWPRTNGDNQVDPRDWLEVGRMAAGLDVTTNSDEMLRADCAPRNAPDGVVTVADWVQAGRYALGLDPLTVVTPPPAPGIAAQKKLEPAPLDGANQTRTLQIGSIAAQRGQAVSVPVQLLCITNENAVGLTVSFDTNQLKLTGVTLGSAMTGGRTITNYNQPGKVGIVAAMASPSVSLTAGTNQVLVLQFITSADASGQAALLLGDSVAIRQVSDKTANALAANYVNGAVVLPPQPTLTTAMTGANLQLTWLVSAGTFQVQSADSPLGPWSDTTLTITTNGANATVTVTATNQQQYFRLVGQ